MKNMQRGIIFTIVLVLYLNAVCSSAATTRNLSLEKQLEKEIIAPNSQKATNEMVVRQSREIGTILMTIKTHFKDIIQSVLIEVWNTVTSFILHVKANLLKKLEAYTVSDVLSVVIDSVVDSTAALEPPLYVETVVEPEPVEVGWEEVYRNPYSLAALLNDN